MSTLIEKLDGFMAEFGLSEHRTGMVLANNGRLIPRLRDGGRIWPETESLIRDAIKAETAARRKARVNSNESAA